MYSREEGSYTLRCCSPCSGRSRSRYVLESSSNTLVRVETVGSRGGGVVPWLWLCVLTCDLSTHRMGSSLVAVTALCLLPSMAVAAGSRAPAQHAHAWAYNEVWSQDDLEFCGWRIRTPALVMTNASVHLSAPIPASTASRTSASCGAARYS